MGYIEELRALIGHRPINLVGAVTLMIDEQGRLLMQQRTFPHGKWGLPGGLMELGESTEEVAKREVLEETGLVVEQLQLLNVYSGQDHFIRAQNGDEFYVVTVAYYTKQFHGTLLVDLEESITCEFFELEQLPANIVQSHRTMIDEYIQKHRA